MLELKKVDRQTSLLDLKFFLEKIHFCGLVQLQNIVIKIRTFKKVKPGGYTLKNALIIELHYLLL